MRYYKDILLKKEKNDLQKSLEKDKKTREINRLGLVLNFIAAFVKVSFNMALIILAFVGLVALINRPSRILIIDLLIKAYTELRYIV